MASPPLFPFHDYGVRVNFSNHDFNPNVIAKIQELGLQVAPHKSEALWFHPMRRGQEPPASYVRVGGSEITVGKYTKYLGLHLDSRWGFEEHFDRLVLPDREGSECHANTAAKSWGTDSGSSSPLCRGRTTRSFVWYTHLGEKACHSTL